MSTPVAPHTPIKLLKKMSPENISGSLNSRPTANFHPCPWGDHFLNLTHHDQQASEPLEELKFIDAIQRLGVGYHFEEDIEKALERMFESYQDQCDKYDLFHVSLLFRILRQHGFNVSSDVFKKFKDENGSFMKSLVDDIPTLLSLYEASYVGVHGDDILDEAVKFTTTHLKSRMAGELMSPFAEQVAHALQQPLHRGMALLESRHYISFCEEDPSHNKALLKLSKLDFNVLQALHKKELGDLTRWWKSLHVKLAFSRDRSTEVYFLMLGTYYEPHFSNARKIFSKLFKMVSLADDTYDAYGTIEELELLTHAIQRLVNQSLYGCLDQMPEHVKWCYQALLETFKEVELELAQEGRLYGLQNVKEQMKILCQAYLQEAKWCHEKYVPTYDEYIDNGYVSCGYPFGIVASFLGMGEIATKEAFEWARQNPMPKAVKALSTTNRLMNDMESHKFEQTRTHVASSVQCHVIRHGALSEEYAHEALKDKVEEAWKDLNEAMLRPFAIAKPLLDRILDMARVSDVAYKGEDGYTIVSQAMKDREKLLLMDPIPI
ncbi:hypothetical protein Cgig2_003789 [Carnegiea gigantea]|uniref:(+)-delta-cadinene synthase n=1 Tax=Carnegiea gigantea TaxID=171969 RepID=A0A9Q1JPD0_9CARY|nr:hypothetical protein Cgig2_003789 [Carnegiea gigantea]